MLTYKAYHHPYKGYCAVLKSDDGQFWQQVSFWYTTLDRLNRYWGEKNRIKLPPKGYVRF